MLRTRFIPIFLLTCLPVGCASWPSASPDAAKSVTEKSVAGMMQIGNRPLQLIALDFVKALQQLERLRPDETIVNFLQASRDDEFTLSMQRALQASGYGVRWISDSPGGQLFQYRHEQEDAQQSGQQDTFEVAIGSVEIRRSYITDDQARIKPVSPLYIRGADASRIILDETHFADAMASEGVPPGTTSRSLKPEDSGQQPRRAAVASSTLSVPDAANPLDLLASGVGRSQGLTLPLTTLSRVENVFELGTSNYEDMLVSHRVMRELILMFPNDSLRLGELNKRLVEQMVSYYQPESDVFSVIGCSLGPTQLKSGNAALALGRASRVREALLFAGIPQDRIFDEGCWAGDSPDNSLPRRGVVVTLNRQV